jgi:hypothetical protein
MATLFFINLSTGIMYGSSSHKPGNSFFDYSTNSYVSAGYDVGYDGAIFPVQNGRIRFRMGISTFVNPLIRFCH